MVSNSNRMDIPCVWVQSAQVAPLTAYDLQIGRRWSGSALERGALAQPSVVRERQRKLIERRKHWALVWSRRRHHAIACMPHNHAQGFIRPTKLSALTGARHEPGSGAEEHRIQTRNRHAPRQISAALKSSPSMYGRPSLSASSRAFTHSRPRSAISLRISSRGGSNSRLWFVISPRGRAKVASAKWHHWRYKACSLPDRRTVSRRTGGCQPVISGQLDRDDVTAAA